jgi:hypothetical protein
LVARPFVKIAIFLSSKTAPTVALSCMACIVSKTRNVVAFANAFEMDAQQKKILKRSTKIWSQKAIHCRKKVFELPVRPVLSKKQSVW